MTVSAQTERIYTELGSIRAELLALKAQLAQVVEQSARSESMGHPHVFSDPQVHRGEPTIRGSAITVRTVGERTRLGDTPEQIVEAYPVLTLAKVYDALAYYYDHPGEIDTHIRENREALWRTKQHVSS